MVHGIAEKVLLRVKETNREIDRYVVDVESHGRTTAIESLFKGLSLQLLAFAFGLGIGRRTIDLYLALPEPLKKPVLWLEYYLYRRWIGARRFFRRSCRRFKAQSGPHLCALR